MTAEAEAVRGVAAAAEAAMAAVAGEAMAGGVAAGLPVGMVVARRRGWRG